VHPAKISGRHPETGERSLDVLRWGLVLFFTTDIKKTVRPINARSETAATSGMFKAALARRRCLVPADAFYEWKAVTDGKQPYAIARMGGAPLAFAGLCEGWKAPGDGEVMRAFTILTMAASDDMERPHDRMPMILEETAWPAWLGEEAGDHLALLRPAPVGVVRVAGLPGREQRAEQWGGAAGLHR
jgi:putative SOS response-associated peptidase YedK